MLYESVSVEDILDHLREQLPFSDPQALEAEMRDRGTDPLFRTYQLSYLVAERAIRNLIQGLTQGQKQQFFFELYTRPMTPEQLLQLGTRIRN
jgi:hypothetical protein